MAKKGKKNNKAGGDIWDEELENEIDSAQEFGATPEPEGSVSTSEEPKEAEEADFLSALKASKDKLEKKAEDEAAKPTLKTKKQKEKEKKEKEKALKKELAKKKKEQQQAQKDLVKQQNKEFAEKQKAEKDAAAAASAAVASASTSPAPESAPELTESSEPAPTTSAPKKKGKKVPAGIAALKRQLELKKQAEEEAAVVEAEQARLAAEEEARLAAEEAARQAELKAKEEELRLERERLKAEGKLLSKRQQQQRELAEKRREQMLATGKFRVAGLQSDSTPKQPPAYAKRKPNRFSKTVETPAEQETPVKVAVKEESTQEKDSEEENAIADDWEKLALEENDEPIVDSWEALEDVIKDEKSEAAEAPSKQPSKEEAPKETPKKVEEQKAPQKLAPEKKSAPVEQKETKPIKAASKIEELDKSGKVSKSASKAAEKESDTSNLRSPICCILGHVDTGKTKLLDKIRQTNVQGGEAGGITQQIGATYFPVEAIKKKTEVMQVYEKRIFEVPGLLIIDTPGHESFTNLRSRGSSLCNIAILVIDIMHGLEQQTIESLRLLRDRKAPFIVALNKIDRLYDWQTIPNNSFRDSFSKQTRSVQQEFEDRLTKIKVALAEQGLNSELYFQNRNMAKYVSIVPTSAVTGEGVPDLLWLLLELTQKRMSKQLMYLSEISATILEVKVVEGFGTTIDVILSNGILREGDRIVLCGLNGPIATNIRALLTPPPSRELRIKSEYIHHKEVKAALGVKIAANDLEKAVAGSRLLVVGPDDDEEELKDTVMDDLTGLLDSVDSSGHGVTVQASTLGSLEALLDFLKDMKIPVMSIGLGPVYKRDVMKATTMLEKDKEYAVMLCFDVKIDKEAEQYADEQGIKIFNADVIYHLFDAFSAYQAKLLEQRRKDFLEYAIFPCVLKTLQIINKRQPMIIGVDVIEGTVRIGTPICAVRLDPETKQRNIMVLGKVTSLEINHKAVDSVKKGQTSAGVAMRLDNPSAAQPVWGRHVDESDTLYSLISRKSIDTLKDPAFRDTVTREDWLLLRKLKPVFDIK